MREGNADAMHVRHTYITYIQCMSRIHTHNAPKCMSHTETDTLTHTHTHTHTHTLYIGIVHTGLGS